MRRLVPPACHPLSYVYSHVATIFLLSVSSFSFFLRVCVCYAVCHGTYDTDRSGCHQPVQVLDVLSVLVYDALPLLFLLFCLLALIVYLPLLLSLSCLYNPGIRYDPLSGYLLFFFSTLSSCKNVLLLCLSYLVSKRCSNPCHLDCCHLRLQ